MEMLLINKLYKRSKVIYLTNPSSQVTLLLMYIYPTYNNHHINIIIKKYLTLQNAQHRKIINNTEVILHPEVPAPAQCAI